MNHWLQLVTYKRGLIHLVFQKSGFLREVVVETFDCIMLCHDLIQTYLGYLFCWLKYFLNLSLNPTQHDLQFRFCGLDQYSLNSHTKTKVSEGVAFKDKCVWIGV